MLVSAGRPAPVTNSLGASAESKDRMKVSSSGFDGLVPRCDRPVHRRGHEPVETVPVEEQAVLLDHRLDEILVGLGGERETLVHEDEEETTLHRLDDHSGDLRPVVPSPQPRCFELVRLDPPAAGRAILVYQAGSLRPVQVVCGVAEERLGVVRQVGAGVA